MLVAIKRIALAHRQALARQYVIWRRAPFATLMTTVVIALVLVLPMLLWLFTQQMQHWQHEWDTGHTIALYLKSELSVTEQQTVLQRVRATEGVRLVALITPEQGFKRLQQDPHLMESLRLLPNNPLPAMLEVQPQARLNTPEKIAALFLHLKQQPEVELAQLDMPWVIELHVLVQFMRTVTYTLLVLFALAVVMIIGNTLRLVVHQQQEELKVLKLIGASEAFMLRPFLYAGLGYGLAGALVAVGLLQLFFYILTKIMQPLCAQYAWPYAGVQLSWGDMLCVTFTGLLLGFIAAKVSVKRQLAAIEPSM